MGSSLAHALVERREQVKGIDNFATRKRENIDDMKDNVDFSEADLLDLGADVKCLHES